MQHLPTKLDGLSSALPSSNDATYQTVSACSRPHPNPKDPKSSSGKRGDYVEDSVVGTSTARICRRPRVLRCKLESNGVENDQCYTTDEACCRVSLSITPKQLGKRFLRRRDAMRQISTADTRSASRLNSWTPMFPLISISTALHYRPGTLGYV